MANGADIAATKIGDAEHSTFAWMNFVVVRSPSPCNEIIGRPGVRKIQAVPSTTHRMLKFPVPGGVLTLRSSRIIPLECAMVSGPKAQPPDVIQATEERIKVAIHSEYPEQTVAMGSTLTEEGRKALLNVQEGCSPVKQKKRGHAPERNKAIQEEVKKLVDADIMKEVHYYSWLSNPVMVKKHDDSWKMCVDFKDLNKACPKDGYPLSKIDWKIGRNLEVYVDDLVIKSRTKHEIIRDIKETFKTLREINMKLNPKKCAFGIEEGMFLGYKVNTKGIKVCLDKFEASNNEAEYKALIVGLKIAEQMGVKNLQVSMDSGLVANQVHCPVPRNPQQKLTPIMSPWPFYKWGIDIAGPFLEGPGKVKFGLPREIISDNGKKLRENPFKDWCEKLCIRQCFAFVKHPQANGLVERANRSLGEGINARLDERSKDWIEEVPHVLWAHRTMIKSSNGDTPFSLTYGTEAVIPAEIGMPTLRMAEIDMV
ncbi:reverse transcriptase domain-containing protein [Tanacetum coccineum]